MNVIKVNVNFKNRTIYKSGVDLTSGDYNSTKLVFEFDKQDGRKVFEMKDPDGELVLLTDIVNNEVNLVGKDENGNNASLFKQEGNYTFEISLYDADSKLTSAFDYIKVKQEQVIVDGQAVKPYLPIFDEMMNELQDSIEKTDNLNINAQKDNNVTTIVITNKYGISNTVQIKDGEQGETGKSGSNATINGVNALNITTSGDISSSQVGNTFNLNVTTPKKTSELINDSGFITDYTEADPTVPNHVKGITQANISSWNNKSDFSGSYDDLANKPTNISTFENDVGYLIKHQDISGKLDTNKVKNEKSTIAGDVYDVRYINMMIGDIESLLGGI